MHPGMRIIEGVSLEAVHCRLLTTLSVAFSIAQRLASQNETIRIGCRFKECVLFNLIRASNTSSGDFQARELSEFNLASSLSSDALRRLGSNWMPIWLSDFGNKRQIDVKSNFSKL